MRLLSLLLNGSEGLFGHRLEPTEPCSCPLITVKHPGYHVAPFHQLSVLIDDMFSDIFISALQIKVWAGQIVGEAGEGWFIHHDDALAHCTSSESEFLNENRTTFIP